MTVLDVLVLLLFLLIVRELRWVEAASSAPAGAPPTLTVHYVRMVYDYRVVLEGAEPIVWRSALEPSYFRPEVVLPLSTDGSQHFVQRTEEAEPDDGVDLVIYAAPMARS